jgi:hypothetical protein
MEFLLDKCDIYLLFFFLQLLFFFAASLFNSFLVLYSLFFYISLVLYMHFLLSATISQKNELIKSFVPLIGKVLLTSLMIGNQAPNQKIGVRV